MMVVSGVYLQRALAWVRIRGDDINARRLHFIECVYQHPSGFQSRLGIVVDHPLKHPTIGSIHCWREVAKAQRRFYSWDLNQLRQFGISTGNFPSAASVGKYKKVAVCIADDVLKQYLGMLKLSATRYMKHKHESQPLIS